MNDTDSIRQGARIQVYSLIFADFVRRAIPSYRRRPVQHKPSKGGCSAFSLANCDPG